ncbi:peroxisomal dehydratase [Gloeopeniophorella convolvens]|nr:peroxisomal dehydratase [Gloeopeniophorella convolvens]
MASNIAPSITQVLESVVGREYGTDPVSWNKRDLLTYALGIGANSDEQQFVNDPAFAAFPTYPVVLFLKGADEEVVEFTERLKLTNYIDGLPYFDPQHLLHASESIEILKPLPLVSGPGWLFKKRIVAIRENKSGVILENEFTLVDPHGTPYARLTSAMFNLTGKITGQRYTRSVSSLPEARSIPRDRAPNWVVSDQTTEKQALIYRLSGDYNPLHIDPKASSNGVILHGLATLGFAARALVRAVGRGNASSLRYISVRFTAPVSPGDGLETSAWDVGVGPDGTTEVAFEVKNTRTGKVVIGGGHARIAKPVAAKL